MIPTGKTLAPNFPMLNDNSPCPACGKRMFNANVIDEDVKSTDYCGCSAEESFKGLDVMHATGTPLWQIPTETEPTIGTVVYETPKCLILHRRGDGALVRTRDKNLRCPLCAGHLVGLCTYEMCGGSRKIGECTSCGWYEPEPPPWMPPKPGENGYVEWEELQASIPSHATDPATRRIYMMARVNYQKKHANDPTAKPWCEIDPRQQLAYLD